MINRKRIKTIAFAVFMAFSMAAFGGCGEKKESNNEVTQAAEAPEKNETLSPAPTENAEPTKEATPAPTEEAAPTAEPTKAPEEEEVAAGPEVLKLSAESGIYASEFSLEISSEDAEYSEIWYTLDGSDPAVSDTALKYDAAVQIKDRKDEPNVVSAVDPDLFCTNYSTIKKKTQEIDCNILPPTDDAVDKCTAIRAVAKNSAGEISAEANAVYFFGTMEDHIKGLAESCAASGTSLAVISLSMDYNDLFDPATGIYVKGDIFDDSFADYLKNSKKTSVDDARKLPANYNQRGREWEREAGMTMLEVAADGTVTTALSHNCGVRIQGNFSRSDLQKGFRLYARKEYGPKNFKYAFFGEDYLNDAGEVMDKYKTIALRAGGNAAMGPKFNDTFWQSLCEDMSVDIQKSRPCVVYLNGEYWGLYVLQEDYSDNYFQNLHGVEKDDVVMYKGDAETYALGYKLDEGEIPEGEKETYYFQELLDFFKNHSDLEKQEDYDAFVKLVDPVSVMEYFAVETWIDNKWDWPGKNWSMWKTTTDDGKGGYGDGRWRFVFYDVEFGGWSGSGDASTNTIKEDNYKPNGLLDMDTTNPAVLCFAYLMTNAGFRADFEAKLESLSNEEFETARATEKLDWFEAVYSPLYEQFFERYDDDEIGNDPSWSIQNIRDFLKKRKNNIKKMVDFCEKVLG